jgi:hypothetical protein
LAELGPSFIFHGALASSRGRTLQTTIPGHSISLRPVEKIVDSSRKAHQQRAFFSLVKLYLILLVDLSLYLSISIYQAGPPWCLVALAEGLVAASTSFPQFQMNEK